jgi:hypothetical protein
MTTPPPSGHPDVDQPENDRHKPDHKEPTRGDHGSGEDDLTATELKEEPPELEAEDEAELAAMDSFPASDPPSFTPTRAGAANPAPVPPPTDTKP